MSPFPNSRWNGVHNELKLNRSKLPNQHTPWPLSQSHDYIHKHKTWDVCIYRRRGHEWGEMVVENTRGRCWGFCEQLQGHLRSTTERGEEDGQDQWAAWVGSTASTTSPITPGQGSGAKEGQTSMSLRFRNTTSWFIWAVKSSKRQTLTD